MRALSRVIMESVLLQGGVKGGLTTGGPKGPSKTPYGKSQAVTKAPDVEAVEVLGLPYCITQHGN